MANYTHLSVTDRRRIYAYMDMGLSKTEIAKKLNRHRSTLHRELNRNKETEGYLPIIAHQKTQQRKSDNRISKIKHNAYLRDYIIKALQKGWSPEQISGRMKYKNLTMYVCHETIYQFIYTSNDKSLYQCLTYKKPKRRKHCSRKPQECRYGKIRLITQRPEAINTRERFGHWEGDTIQFQGTKSKVVTTLVERKSRMVSLIKNSSKHSQGVMNKIKAKFKELPSQMCKTITFDQGCEFADYRQLEQELHCQVYYCETHSPWQKGSNENMNGRLRRYLPSSIDIANFTQEELDKLADKMNHCPRKCIGFKTPHEVFIQQRKNDCRTWS